MKCVSAGMLHCSGFVLFDDQESLCFISGNNAAETEGHRWNAVSCFQRPCLDEGDARAIINTGYLSAALGTRLGLQ